MIQWSDIVLLIHLNDEDLLKFLQDNGLVRRQYRCPLRRCRRACTLQKRVSNVLGACFRCKGCRSMSSVLAGSFFARGRIDIRVIVQLMWVWAAGLSVGQTVNILSESKVTVVQYYRRFREVCSWELRCRPDLFRFGGDGCIVQIGDSMVTKHIYKRGKFVQVQQWLFGIYDITSKRGHIMLIPDRRKATLTAAILRFVRPGSTICTSDCEGYGDLQTLGGVSPYVHETGACTSDVKRYLSRLKRYVRSLGVTQSKYIPAYIDQFLWKQAYGATQSDRFGNLVQQISEKYCFKDKL